MVQRTFWAVGGLFACAASIAIAGPAAAASGWAVVSVPGTGNNVIINGMSARTSTDAWAVGTQFVAAGQARPHPRPITGTGLRGR